MPKKLKIGIVGCGAIGSSLAKIISTDFKKRAEVVVLFDIDKNKSEKLASLLRKKSLVSTGLEKLIKKSGLVIEATHARHSFGIARKVLSGNSDCLVMSVGGIIGHLQELSLLAERKGRKVFIPSGAICGLDGLKAAAGSKITKVMLTTTKPPSGFGLPGLKKDKVLFEGNALQAVKKFPQNINVAAALSLAGIGAKKTKVRIVASPKIKRNIHAIEIVSSSGTIRAITENVPHPDNPKTSYLAVLSAVATLREILEPIKIGT